MRATLVLALAALAASSACRSVPPRPPAAVSTPLARAVNVEEALERALGWLVANQASDGAWPCDANGESPVAPTALAVIALTRDREPSRQESNHEPVVRGVKWLLGRIDSDGRVAASEIEHGIATLALCEAYAKSRSWLLKPYVQRAVNHAARERDASASEWTDLALAEAKVAGLKVGERASDSKRFDLPSAPPPWNEPWRESDLSAWYLAVRTSGETAAAWSEALASVALDAQRADGELTGSFDPLEAASALRGRASSTALVACCLVELANSGSEK